MHIVACFPRQASKPQRRDVGIKSREVNSRKASPPQKNHTTSDQGIFQYFFFGSVYRGTFSSLEPTVITVDFIFGGAFRFDSQSRSSVNPIKMQRRHENQSLESKPIVCPVVLCASSIFSLPPASLCCSTRKIILGSHVIVLWASLSHCETSLCHLRAIIVEADVRVAAVRENVL